MMVNDIKISITLMFNWKSLQKKGGLFLKWSNHLTRHFVCPCVVPVNNVWYKKIIIIKLSFKQACCL